MDKQKVIKTSLWIIGISVGAVVIFKLVDVLSDVIKRNRQSKSDADEGTETETSTKSTTSAPSVSAFNWMFPLQWGSGSTKYNAITSDKLNTVKNSVKSIQRVCNYYGADLTVDGIWGNKTEAAVAQLKDLELWQTQRTVCKPFFSLITSVKDPRYSTSKLEISYANSKSIIDWYNENRKQYKTTAQMFGGK